jgi:ribokinase
MSVIVVGGANRDLSIHVARRPGPGETVLATGSAESNGGKGANQAWAAARAGAAVEFYGAVGRDAAGADQLDELRRAGVDPRVSIVDDLPTGLAVITVTDDGENSITVVPGANLRAAEAVPSSVPAAATVLVQTEIGWEATERAMSRARRSGARLIVNAAPVLDVDPAAWKCDLLIVNQHEAADVLAQAGLREEDPQEVARRIAAITGAAVCVTYGAGGATLCDGPDADVQHLPTRAVRAVDTTGSGDTFVGHVAARVTMGDSWERAVRSALEAATRSVQHPGARVW